MKVFYEVILDTQQPDTNGHDYWMYRNFNDKSDAMATARLLSTFHPFVAYPTTITVKQLDKDNPAGFVIFKKHLKNEDSAIFTLEPSKINTP